MAHSFTSPRPLLGETDMRPLHSQIKPLLGDVDNRKLRRLGSQPIHPHKTNGGLPFEIEDPYSISSDSKPFLDETLKGDAIPTCEGRTGTDATPTNIKVAARSSAQPPSPNDRTSADGMT